MRYSPLLAPALTLSLLLTGCAVSNLVSPPLADQAGKTSGTGSVHGGQQPIGSATLTIFSVGNTGYGSAGTALTTATAGPTGNFTIAAPDCTSIGAGTTLYILAAGGDSGSGVNANIMLGAALGPCSAGLPAFININEVTTAAMAYAMGQFFTPNLGGTDAASDSFGTGAGEPLPLANAAQSTFPVLANLATGKAKVTATSGTLTTTPDSAKLYSIANTIAACVNTAGVGGSSTNCAMLFKDTTPPGMGMRAPVDTLQAAVQMSLFPYQNVAALYALASGSGAPYIGLPATPNDWTLGVAYTSTAFGLTIAGTADSGTSSNIDIDANGNVWFPSNTASSHGMGVWNIASTSFSGPYATGLIAPQYVAIDPGGTVWGSDGAAGQVLGVSIASPTTTASAVILPAGATATGPVTFAPAYSNGAVSGYAMSVVATSAGAANVSSYSGSTLVSSAAVTGAITGLAGTEADASQTVAYTAGNGASAPCILGQAVTYNNFAPQLASAPPCQSGGVLSTYNTEDTMMTATIMSGSGGTLSSQICSQKTASCFAPPVALAQPQGAASDGDSNLWVANAQPNVQPNVQPGNASGGASVSTFGYARGAQGTPADYFQTSPIAYLHGTGNGATMTAPYGLAIDGAGNVWVSNAGCVVTAAACADPASFTLSELIGAAAPTRTPLSAQNATAINGNTIGTRP